MSVALLALWPCSLCLRVLWWGWPRAWGWGCTVPSSSASPVLFVCSPVGFFLNLMTGCFWVFLLRRFWSAGGDRCYSRKLCSGASGILLGVGQVKGIWEMKGVGYAIWRAPGFGHRPGDGLPVPELAGGREAEAPSAAGVQPVDKLRGTPIRGRLRVTLMSAWKTAWCCTGW